MVTGKLYDTQKSGSFVSNESTWQMAVAMAVGRVKDKFEKMDRTVTGIAVWVNTLDMFKYLGGAQVTMRTAFGQTYLQNFLGADIIFVTSKIPKNAVCATPLNNLIAYYLDPADSEFVNAGLSYTVNSETRFISGPILKGIIPGL